MAYLWSPENAKTFWEKRNTFLLFQYNDLVEKIAQYKQNMQTKTNREIANKADFLHGRTFQAIPVNAAGINQVFKIASDLKFWSYYNSWTFCSSCNSLNTKPMQFNFANRPKNSLLKKCPCKEVRYVIPKYQQIPTVLLSLTSSDVEVLRPFYIIFETYERHSHGYRVKCCPMKLRISDKSVEEKINALTDETQKLKCQNAYTFLMSSHVSSYSYYVQLREHLLASNDTLNLFNFRKTQGIECVIWPNLYPFTAWCESNISDGGTHLSSKVSFYTKLFSEILDYGMHFDLLQFQYDRWLFKTVSGAVNTARFLRCSPARALETKTFSATYWQWQHRYVLDAVDQFGLPDVFITISPFEWSFPFPSWLDEVRMKTGKGPTELPGFETAHIVHTLAQLVRGYLCGSNSKKWSNHIFSYNAKKDHSNVKTFFYRFEFQKRGTAHLHLLIWLNDITKIQHKYIRADLPDDNPDLSYLASKYQPSDKPSSSLKL